MEIVSLLSRANEVADEMLKLKLTKKQKEIAMKYLEVMVDNLYSQLKEVEKVHGKDKEITQAFTRITENIDKRMSEGIETLGQFVGLWNAIYLTSMLMFFLTTSPSVFVSTNLALLSDWL